MITVSKNHLVQRAQCGETIAFVEIYEQHHATIYSYIYFRTGNTAVAEDLCAEVFVRVVDKIHTFQDQGKPILSWLYTIAHNLIIDYRRTHGNEPQAELSEEDFNGNGTDNHPLFEVESRLDQACLIKAMNQLTEEQRKVVFLKFIEGRSNMEIADIMDKTEGAVKSLQHRALSTLKSLIETEVNYGKPVI